MTNRPLELIKGTLDVLILKTLADGPLHGDVRLLLAVRFGRARLIDNDGVMVPSA